MKNAFPQTIYLFFWSECLAGVAYLLHQNLQDLMLCNLRRYT